MSEYTFIFTTVPLTQNQKSVCSPACKAGGARPLSGGAMAWFLCLRITNKGFSTVAHPAGFLLSASRPHILVLCSGEKMLSYNL